MTRPSPPLVRQAVFFLLFLFPLLSDSSRLQGQDPPLRFREPTIGNPPAVTDPPRVQPPRSQPPQEAAQAAPVVENTPPADPAEEQVYRDPFKKIQFEYPDSFSIGFFSPQADPTGFFTSAIVLVDRRRLPEADPRNLAITEEPLISIVPVRGEKSLAWQHLSDPQSPFWKDRGQRMPQAFRIGKHTVAKLPDFPATFGRGALVYTVPGAEEDTIWVVMALREFSNGQTTPYDPIIQEVIGSLEFLP